MTDRLVEILFTAASVLLAPILVLLVLMSAASLWMLGGIAGEAIDRRRGRAAWSRFLAGLKQGRAFDPLHHATIPGEIPSRFRDVLQLSRLSPAGAKKAIEDMELAMARRLSVLSFATRLGPMLGLIGTLLPLGPALRGLANDDLATLAGDLEIAFTSTVFGLLIGGIAYAAGLVRRNWYDQDLADLEFALENTPARAATNSAEVKPPKEAAHA